MGNLKKFLSRRKKRRITVCLAAFSKRRKWESGRRMASLTTTHRHDYRWPTNDCLVPRAEAPSDKCEVRPEGCEGGQGDKPWCGRSSPPKLLPTRPRVCADLVPPSGLTDRPWCQRGPLVPLINPAAITTPVQPRLQPTGCLEPAPARPWCDADATGDAVARITPARVGAAPQQDISRYNQPDQYLRKLCDKYPKPTAVVTATPRDELVRRVYADRYRTTYQTDFCKNADDAARQLADCDSHDVYNKHAPLSSISPPPTPVNGNNGGGCDDTQQYVSCKCGCGCRVAVQSAGDVGAAASPRLRPLACRPAAVSHNVHFSCCTPKKKPGQGGKEEVGPPEKIQPWASEYSESIGRTGQMIMEQRLLYPKKKN